jgi:hypothetical protein
MVSTRHPDPDVIASGCRIYGTWSLTNRYTTDRRWVFRHIDNHIKRMLTLSLESFVTWALAFAAKEHKSIPSSVPNNTANRGAPWRIPGVIFVLKTRDCRLAYSGFCLNEVHNSAIWQYLVLASKSLAQDMGIIIVAFLWPNNKMQQPNNDINHTK